MINDDAANDDSFRNIVVIVSVRYGQGTQRMSAQAFERKFVDPPSTNALGEED